MGLSVCRGCCYTRHPEHCLVYADADSVDPPAITANLAVICAVFGPLRQSAAALAVHDYFGLSSITSMPLLTTLQT